MIQIQELTTDAWQAVTVQLADGSQVAIALEYKPNQLGWFITSLIYTPTNSIYNSRKICGKRLTAGVNVLRQYKNLMPFGLIVTTTDSHDPTLQNDLAPGGRASVYIMDAADVAYYETQLSGA